MPEPAAGILKRSFPPVADASTRLLILGSLPGEQSLAAGRYYANPRNQFWRLTGAVIGSNIEPLPYEQRLTALLAAGIGLWDSVASATRQGSLDGAIRGHEANDLATLAASLPQLRAVAFNGQKSAAIGRFALAEHIDLAFVTLPSSSPALTLPFEAKRAEWVQLRRYLA